MSIARKTTVVHGMLLLLTLWPFVHIGLVWRYDLSPWKLAGWGMYTTPRFGLIGMDVSGHAPARERWEPLAAPSPALQQTATAFLEQHRWLRRLARATALVDAVAREHPDWDAVRIAVSYPAIDLATGMVVMRRDEREYPLR